MIKLKKLFEGQYDMNNLAESNSYYKVIEPFDVYIDTGKTKASNYYYGASQLQSSIYKKIKTKVGDIIENLHGGVFYIDRDDSSKKRISVKLEDGDDVNPFEKNSRKFQKWPLDKLQQIESDGK